MSETTDKYRVYFRRFKFDDGRELALGQYRLDNELRFIVQLVKGKASAEIDLPAEALPVLQRLCADAIKEDEGEIINSLEEAKRGTVRRSIFHEESR